MSNVTKLLDAIQNGEPKAAQDLIPLVYDSLKRIAARKMSNQPPGQTLQPTALVHEAYLKLVNSECRNWQGRAHFFNAAAEAMRQLLIDRARRKARLKHGGANVRVEFERLDLAVDTDDETLLLVNDALHRLSMEDPQAAEFVKLRFYVGLSTSEIAEVLNVSERTAKRIWAFARSWLFCEMKDNNR